MILDVYQHAISPQISAQPNLGVRSREFECITQNIAKRIEKEIAVASYAQDEVHRCNQERTAFIDAEKIC